MSGIWMYGKEGERPPSGCTYCGIGERLHFNRWTDEARWHEWTTPTDTQIKTRMLNRRAQRDAPKIPPPESVYATVLATYRPPYRQEGR